MNFFLNRAVFMLLTFFIVVSSVFFLLRLAPGGPFDGERRLPPSVEANLRAAYNLDAPLPAQYFTYWKNLLSGDLGPSFRQKDFSVNDLIKAGLPVSLGLGASALGLALLMGLSIGITAGLKPGSMLDSWLMAFSNINIAIPTIVLAPVLILIFSVALSWFPAGGTGSIWHFILPSIALSLPYAAAVARLIRGSVAEVRNLPYVTTAKAKGLNRIRVVRKHVLPIALIPLISYLGPAAAGLLTGSVVVEQIFSLPGIGRYFVEGALARDYTLVMGVVVVYSAAILLFNFLVDITYGWLDPRIRANMQANT